MRKHGLIKYLLAFSMLTLRLSLQQATTHVVWFGSLFLCHAIVSLYPYLTITIRESRQALQNAYF